MGRGRQLIGIRALVLCLLALGLVPAQHAWSQGPARLELRFEGFSDRICDPPADPIGEEIAYYAGGMYDFRIRVLPDGKRAGEVEYAGVTDWIWPAGLVIHVAQAGSPNAPFVPIHALRERIGLQYYVRDDQTEFDSLWRATGRIPHRSMRAPEYHFAFRVPPELAGAYLCFGVEWQHPQYGLLTYDTPYCMKTIAPCFEAAQHVVWRTHVEAALDQGEFALACARADSFMAEGWRDIWGLVMAMNAAMQIARYDDAIRYLDVCFEANHHCDPMFPPQGDMPPSGHARQGYERQRARLLELKQRR